MDSIADLLQKKADTLDLKRGDDLQIIQIELDRLFGADVAKASSINKEFLVITTGSPANMTTIRYSQTQILAAIRNQTEHKIERVVIKIR